LGLPFKVSEAVLDPRPDTETIIEATFQHFQDKPLRTILDLGTGSGCLIVTLLHEFPDSRGVAVDISESALAIARENADRNGVLDRCTFVKSDWDDSFTADLPSKYDLIVSNPPYIPNQDIANLLDEVKKHDPSLALDGGNDGLDAYKKIIPIINSHLNRDGISLLEIGISQEKDVTRIAANAGLTPSRIHSDLGGIPRVVEISK
jgi:release factor glutamine methyltransferase